MSRGQEAGWREGRERCSGVGDGRADKGPVVWVRRRRKWVKGQAGRESGTLRSASENAFCSTTPRNMISESDFGCELMNFVSA